MEDGVATFEVSLEKLGEYPAQNIIHDLNAQGVSLMPAGLLTGYTDDQVRDLMAYLRSTQPLNN